MDARLTQVEGWAAVFSGIAAILALVSLVLFFTLEANTPVDTHIWGPISDVAPIFQMASLLVVAQAFYQVQRREQPAVSFIAWIIGMAGMLGVVLLQLLLRSGAIPFEREVGWVLLATGAVGVWLILVNDVARRQQNLPPALAWLGVVVGAAFVMQPVMLSLGGGATAWRSIMSNPLLLIISAVVFLVTYVGFPLWAIRLGRAFLRRNVAPNYLA